jgi:hypothetical protein
MKLKYLPLLRNWNAALLVSVIEAESRNPSGGVKLDAVEFHIRRVRSDGPFVWDARAKCSNESRTGFGGADFVTLRTQGGFATVDGALGALSEVAAMLPAIYPDVTLVLYAPGWILKRFDSLNMAWEPLPERNWTCRSCDNSVTMSPLLWFRSWSPMCQQCETLMREVERPGSVAGVPGP